ncbi:MAG: type I methionyl aminopeptidase [Oscillospiraceae bacterium]|nr:type I methionyl aminopeptidase [Oscillospiraceae bacterium]
MYSGFPRFRPDRGRIVIKTEREIKLMMKASEISAGVLSYAESLISPGISTWELNREIGNFIKQRGAKPSFKGMYGFPGNACISINQELIHGIPSKKRHLREGDIISIDVGAFKDGFHGDNAATFICGGFGNYKIPDEVRRLVKTTESALSDAIKQCYSGNRIGDISHAVQTRIEGEGYFIPDDFHGHGVGRELHEDPNIPNVGKPGRGTRLVPGMTIAIEPMVNSTTEKIRILRDEWTVVEGNGNLSAHFEHTVLITKSEPIVMTRLT